MKKKLVGLLLCLSMVLAIGLLPTAVRAGEPTELTASSFEDGGAYSGYTLTGGDSESAPAAYKLGGDIELSKTLVITGYVSLDLNGHGLTLSATEGSVIQIGKDSNKGYLTLKDDATNKSTTHWTVDSTTGLWSLCTTDDCEHSACKSVTGGTITGGKGTKVAAGGGITYTEGGGVYIKKGSLTMTGGTIVGNTAEYGGGVDGTFTMTGGTIVGNTATNSGGGVYLGSSSTFTMSGTALISGNTAKNGGGVAANWDGTININGGTISGNTATGGNGGGVSLYNSSTTLTMTGGSITGNTATASGGNGGNGGGVRVAGGTFNMSGGTIGGETAADGNTAKNGGGVYVETYSTTGGKFTMSGSASVKNNNASTNGGGVYVESGSVILSGGAQINSNWKGGTKAAGATAYTDGTANNVYLTDGNKISVSGGLTGGKKCIGVSTEATPAEDSPVTVVIPVSSYTLTDDDRKAFFPDDSSSYHIEEGTYTTSTGDVTCFNLCLGMRKEQEDLTVTMTSWTYGNTANEPIYTKADGADDVTILYRGRGTTTYTESATRPTDVGEYTVTVSFETGSTIYTGTADFTISPAPSVVNRVEVSVDDDRSTLAVPTVPEPYATTTQSFSGYTATVYDQYGQEMTDKTVTWSVTSATGVTLKVSAEYPNSPVIVLTHEAQNGTVTITATVTKADGTTASDSKDITISRDPKATFVYSIFQNDDLLVPGEDATIYVPASGSSTYTYTAAIFDQYGVQMTSGYTVNWEWSSNNSGNITSGLTINENALTVNSDAVFSEDETEVDYTLTAKVSDETGGSASVPVKIKKRADAGVTLTDASSTTYGTPITITASVPAGTASGQWSWDYDSEVFSAEVDDSTITLTPKKADTTGSTVTATYDGTEVYGTKEIAVTVAKKTLTVDNLEFTEGSTFTKVYDGKAACTTATVQIKDGTKVNDSDVLPTVSGSYTYNSADVTGATQVTYTTTAAESDNYILPEGLEVTNNNATITARPITVAVSVEDKTYDGTKTATVDGVTFTGLQNSEALVNGTDYTVTAEFTDANAGGEGKTVTYTVTLNNSAAAKNYVFSTGTGTTAAVTDTTTAKIEQKSITVTVAVDDKTYDGTETATVSGVTFTGLVTGETLTKDTDYTVEAEFADANAGDDKTVTYTVTLKDSAAAKNYSLSVGTGTATADIDPAAATVTTAPRANTLTYTGDAQALVTAGAASGGTMQYKVGENGTWSADIPTGTNATNYTIWYEAVGDSNHSDSEPVSLSVTIGKASLTVTAMAKAITYGDAPDNNGVTCSGFVNSETATVLGGTPTYSYSYEQYDKVGNYTITPDGLTSNNYDIEFKSGTLTVEKKEVSITWGSGDLTYTGSAQAPAVTVTGAVNNESVTATVTGAEISAGTGYTATVTGLSSNNYKLPTTGLTKDFSIAKATLTNVSAAQTGTLTYTGSAQTATVTAVATAKGNQTVSFTYSTEQDGTYSAAVPAFTSGTHTVYYKASADNHETASGSFTVTVGKATVTVTAADKSAYTGSTAPDLSSPVEGTDYTLSGLIGTDTLSSAVSLTCDADMSKAGSYDIVPSVTDEDERYAFVFVNGTLTVSNRPVSSRPAHKVDVKDALNGSVTANQTEAREGTVVTVTVDPAIGYALDELTVVDKNGNAIAVTSLGGGKYTFIMPDSDVVVRTTFTDGTSTGFVDVPVNKYFYDAVNWAVANGITSGVDAAHFAPYASCTRGQLVTFLWRAAGQPAAKATENAFGDVKETSSFYKAILWAAENGIVGGYDDGTFHPGNAISRQQTAAILYRYAKYAKMDVSVGEDTNILSFNDATSVSEYAVAAFQWATGAQVITGNGANLLPYDTCTRAQIVTMLYRLLAK